jgi:outer membrane protein OmpA-like peptidoglycan-associated protein
MTDSNKDSNKSGVFSSLGFLAAGMTVAAVAYFFAKPAHQAVEQVAETPVVQASVSTAASNINDNENTLDVGGENGSTAMNPQDAYESKNKLAEITTATPSITEVDTHSTSVSTAAVVQSDAQIFFAVGQSTLSEQAQQSLAVVVEKMKANTATKAVLSGYTDATGNKAQNELLAKERAKSVRNFLRKAGVAGADDARIEMLKPETLVGSSDADKARRVEVTVK